MKGKPDLRGTMAWLAASLLLVLAGGAAAWALLGRPATGIDDADIFLVYARHLAQGHGLVYNIGGGRVEGFTSLLWVLVESLLFRFFQSVERPLLLLNICFASAVIAACLESLPDSRPSRAGFLALVLVSPAWFAWSVATLMETGLWCLLLTLATLLLCREQDHRRHWKIAAVLVLMLLTRPEAMAWGLWMLGLLFADETVRNGWRTGLRRTAPPLAAFVVALAGLTVFRLAYFGYPLPNTYYAKISPELSRNLYDGTFYLLRYLASNPVGAVAAAVACAVALSGARRVLRGDRSAWNRSEVVALCILPGIGIPVLVGGDHFAGFRFYQPLWPLLCLLVALEFPAWPLRSRRALAGLAVVSGLLSWGWFACDHRLGHEFDLAARGRRNGRALTAIFSDAAERPTVAVITAGGIKYGYNGPVLDMMGLNAPQMAHAPGSRHGGYKNHVAFNRDVFEQWSPDIVVPHGSAAAYGGDFDALVLHGLMADSAFRARYVPVALSRGDASISVLAAKAFLARIDADCCSATVLGAGRAATGSTFSAAGGGTPARN